ncbi:MAG: hypothetical protein U9P72_10400 [Campylobacterota bacterium]|nr:hypothetical protein [Campylobacterota bacterium]
MKFNFNKKLSTIFLDSYSEYEQIDSKVNVILSPSLYWVKKISLPVKYIRDVEKLLPSIFEDILPEGNYSYSAYKSENDEEFIVFAYSDKMILDTLSQKGISLSNVANIYFAQSEIIDIESAFKINATQSIYIKDEILILIPCCWIEEMGKLDVSDIKHSNHKITLHQFGHIVETKSLYKIGAILMLMILLLGTEYFITAKKASMVLDAKEEIFQNYKLKSTTFQNKALLKKYNSVYASQIKIREYISYLLKLKLKDGERISFVNIKNKKMLVSFTGVSKNRESVIKKILSSKGISFKIKSTKDSMRIEASL